MRWIPALFVVALATSAVAADHVRFVVTGDDRWNSGHPRPGLDENGVNVGGFGRVVKAIIAEKPDALLLSGDLVGGAKTDEEEASQLQTFLKVMQPVYDAKITVLAGRGNHEMHCPHADEIWRKAFSGPYSNPATGPDDETDLTYAYPMKNCLFIALDEFEGPELGINQKWLDGVLKAPHPPHIFAFAHKMAFYSGHHTDGLPTVPAARDALIKSLVNAGSRVIFFGHDHLYDHLAAKLPGWPDGKAMHQVVVGTAGAPFVKGKTMTDPDEDWNITHIARVEQKLGYVVVDVNGNHVKLVFKAESSPGVFEAADTLEYDLPKGR